MKEKFFNPVAPKPEEKKPENKNIPLDKEGLGKALKEYRETYKANVMEMFGREEIPKDIMNDVLAVNKEIKKLGKNESYINEVDEYTDDMIKKLFVKISFYQEKRTVKEIEEKAEEGTFVSFDDGGVEKLDSSKEDLLQSLRMYFDSYRIAVNAGQFKKNLKLAQKEIVEQGEARILNVFSKAEKDDLLPDKLMEKYEKAGFTKEEVTNLIELSEVESLEKLEIHDIDLLVKIKDVFERFMKGDKTKYTALSVGMTIPAFLEGWAPIFLSNAFKGDKMAWSQIGIYALLSSLAAGGSLLMNKFYKDFINANFRKEEGIDESVTENLAEMPAHEIGKFGSERIKNRIGQAREGYETIVQRLSFDILPAAITLGTSATLLYDKNPALAAGTAAGAGLMIFFDRFFNEKMKFWKKWGNAQKEIEQVASKLEEQLKAHLEIILSGEKEKFMATMTDLLQKARVAETDKSFLRLINEKFYQFYGKLNVITAAAASAFAGGSADMFIAALAYSGRFDESIQRMLSARRELLSSARDVMQMDLMFNGYAEEEKEKEKNRVGIDEVTGGDIALKNVDLEFYGKKILDNADLEIPQGSMVSLEGASGEGKTSLMKIISGYYQPTSGKVSLGGTQLEDIKKSGPDSIYSRIAYLSQFPYIMDDNVRNNLIFGNPVILSDDQIKEILKEVGLNKRLPSLDERLIGGRGDSGNLSGGEASRLGLARILLKIKHSQTKIVFLDEPTASVDDKTKGDIAKIINEEKKKKPDVTFVVISHDKDFIRQLDCTIKVKMEKGRISQQENNNL